MLEVIGFFLTLLIAGYIAYPLFQKRITGISFESNHRAEELEARKAEIYRAIKDIDFDFEMGKLSEEDHHALRDKYKADAVSLLKQIDQKSKKKRGNRASKLQRKQSTKFCENCGARISKSANFCPQCGTAQTQ